MAHVAGPDAADSGPPAVNTPPFENRRTDMELVHGLLGTVGDLLGTVTGLLGL